MYDRKKQVKVPVLRAERRSFVWAPGLKPRIHRCVLEVLEVVDLEVALQDWASSAVLEDYEIRFDKRKIFSFAKGRRLNTRDRTSKVDAPVLSPERRRGGRLASKLLLLSKVTGGAL